MATIQTQEDLLNAISHLEQRQLLEKSAVQKHFDESYESLQPVNLLNSALTEINDTNNLKKDMLKAAIALAIGYIAKKIIQTYLIKSRSPLAIGIENLLQVIISGIIAKNGNLFKDIALYFFKTILQHKQKQLSVSESK